MFVIDIIGLAGINQLYGNKFGDEVLKRIAIILKGGPLQEGRNR